MTLEQLLHILENITPDEHGCHPYPGVHIKPPPRPNIYCTANIAEEGKINSPQIRLHRLVLERKLGRPIRPGFHALHHCDNKRCVNPDHLYEGTHKDNMRDRSLRNPAWLEKARIPFKIYWAKNKDRREMLATLSPEECYQFWRNHP
jgi:HNH endonuclease